MIAVGLTLACALGAALGVGPETASTTLAPVGHEPGRSGLLGWGLGLELPMVGIMTGAGADSAPGWGYTLGASLAWEATPAWLVRLTASGAESYGARASVRYEAVSGATTDRADADWSGLGLALGVAHLWREAGRTWTPYAGGDAGITFGGYSYRFAKTDPACADPNTCETDVHSGSTYGWSAALHSGVRLEMLSWLATQAELGLTYSPVLREDVSNTPRMLAVRSIAEGVWLARATFAVRLAL